MENHFDGSALNPRYEKLEKQISELAAENERLRNLIESLPQMVVETDLEGNLVYANQTTFEITGYSRDDFADGLSAIQLVIPEERSKAVQNIRKILQGEKLQGNEYTALRKDGSTYPVQVFSSYKIENGAAGRMRAIIIDITERKKAEERLQKSEALLKAITSTALDCIFCKGSNRRYTFVNPAMTDLLKCDESHLLGKTPEEIFGPEAGAIIKEVDDLTFSGRKVSEVRQLAIHGEGRFFHTIQVPMQVENGEVLSITGIVRDVTEPMHTQAKLAEYRDQLEKKVQ